MTTPTTPPTRRRAPARRPAPGRRSPGAVAVSVVLHGGLVVLLGHALTVPAPYLDLLSRLVPPPQAERVSFVETPRALGAPEPEGGGDGRRAAPPAPAPAAPTRTPDAVAPPAPDAEPVAEPAPTAPPADAAGGRGTGQGSGVGELTGPGAGLRPAYTGNDAIWLRPGDPIVERPTRADSLDAVITADLAGIRDSLAVEAGRRQPGDWTFQRGGRTYGMSPQFLHLGPISIPTPLLGLLPIRNQQANPIARERERRLNDMGAESRVQARRRQDDFDVSARIAEIRKRREAERASRRGTTAAGSGASAGSPP